MAPWDLVGRGEIECKVPAMRFDRSAANYLVRRSQIDGLGALMLSGRVECPNTRSRKSNRWCVCPGRSGG